MTVNVFLEKLQNNPDNIEFTDTMAVIDARYDFTETEFKNGGLLNKAGENSGSCKLFAFAQLQQLSKEQTLACFGAYYRNDVLKNSGGTDHQNIRHFMTHSWSGITFSGMPLKEKV
ncbi:MAG: HopJ type III effector protein [gamma proteobacterium symbiont of Bathyaustriella thionipta]|nr:HopJ type III effector protein [gamma proteobacterium symbiont of Bathyaustriella thionipta]MCU7949030.1 HopJ type III effector protein [gamma proteobacterium symbiont of Bathyaustriella thionipta]MCU7954517.1 HopJ type III effector protein [gamma proteobacterium symbiont of Bathyaustriella thionipta]MCU7955614.1 HopJ type III effector protein [gamma proteobacterium symbiont of Bathyaustriella thionipta]MCU7968612.1 HopJ type III effector protein [gamma proteobacterium symbiont of Bathyaustr